MKPEKKEKRVKVSGEHPEWELEKQTEGLDPEVEKASDKLEKELTKEAAEA